MRVGLAVMVMMLASGAVLADINVGLLYILAISSLGVYGVIIAGWASNSKYPFFSAMRASAQMISYEVSIGFILICVVLWADSFNLNDIIEAQRGHGLGLEGRHAHHDHSTVVHGAANSGTSEGLARFCESFLGSADQAAR